MLSIAHSLSLGCGSFQHSVYILTLHTLQFLFRLPHFFYVGGSGAIRISFQCLFLGWFESQLDKRI
ncbi:hypothetical protein SCHPADRAFT_348398 [Schizopora paradoxa]|uniref:Uncharacterized protein n=1 Tax=Schizopora paradoxa TaxID=27342 RepID=A0A0H2RNX9_9AGAM|nr:hypothetical protein SCHPADRAFT_348398 [Schizopora paradoxa]